MLHLKPCHQGWGTNPHPLGTEELALQQQESRLHYQQKPQEQRLSAVVMRQAWGRAGQTAQAQW